MSSRSTSSNTSKAPNIEGIPESIPADSLSTRPPKKKHNVVIGIIITIIVLIIFALGTAFVWPGWATHSTSQTSSQAAAEADGTPTISPIPFTSDATALVKALPDSVGAYVRKDVVDSKTWASASPIEEHTVVYSTGDASKDVTLIVAQWAKADSAKTQYDSLTQSLSGKKIASGNIKVSGQRTGSYEFHQDANDAQKGIAVWQNDTAVFQVNGPVDQVQAFYTKFSM